MVAGSTVQPRGHNLAPGIPCRHKSLAPALKKFAETDFKGAQPSTQSSLQS